MRRYLAFGYGLVCYLAFFASFLYAIGFVGDFVVPKSIDSGTVGAFWPSLLIDVGLLGLFALQHSGMARPGFKQWWTKIIPASIERSTYVLLASLTLALIFWQWQPLPAAIWSVEAAWGQWLLWGGFALGWGIVLIGTFMISHAHLFGLQQVYERLQGETLSSPEFKTPGFYQYVRHPLMLGFLIAFWSTPHMTTGHFVFAIATTAYVLVALQLEERDLVARFGARYRAYRERVPMLLPWPRETSPAETTA